MGWDPQRGTHPISGKADREGDEQMMRHRVLAALAIGALALALGACSKNADPNPTIDLSEKGAIGPHVGLVSTTTTIPTAVTSHSGTYASGDGTRLPLGWPSEVKIPHGVDIGATNKAGQTLQATGQITSAPKTVYDEIKDNLTGSGFELSANSFTPTDNGGFGTLSASNDRYNVSIYVGPDSESRSGNFLTITVGDQG